MPTTLLLLRHAATAANVTLPYTIQGLHEDNELNAVGELQAQAAAKFLKAYPATKVYASPLKRARMTAQHIADYLNVPIATMNGLVEADVGVWAGLSWEEIQRRWPAEFAAFHDDAETHGYLGGENLAQVRDRLLPVIEQLISVHPEETLVVVGHGVANRVLLAHWLGLPLRYARRLPQDNTGISIVKLHEGNAKVRTLNSVIHLDDI